MALANVALSGDVEDSDTEQVQHSQSQGSQQGKSPYTSNHHSTMDDGMAYGSRRKRLRSDDDEDADDDEDYLHDTGIQDESAPELGTMSSDDEKDIHKSRTYRKRFSSKNDMDSPTLYKSKSRHMDKNGLMSTNDDLTDDHMENRQSPLSYSGNSHPKFSNGSSVNLSRRDNKERLAKRSTMDEVLKRLKVSKSHSGTDSDRKSVKSDDGDDKVAVNGTAKSFKNDSSLPNFSLDLSALSNLSSLAAATGTSNSAENLNMEEAEHHLTSLIDQLQMFRQKLVGHQSQPQAHHHQAVSTPQSIHIPSLTYIGLTRRYTANFIVCVDATLISSPPPPIVQTGFHCCRCRSTRPSWQP